MRRDEPAYRLSLARALSADGQDDAARQTLMGLRADAPEDPEINLLLARLESRRQDVTAAVRYYQNALYGSWDADRLDEREQLRMELVAYLLENNLRDRALAELLIIAADLPDDAARRIAVAELFLASGDPQRALEQFRRALEDAPSNDAALAGAARAAAGLGDYVSARGYLRRAPAGAGLDPLRATVEHVLTSDPLAPRLSRAERRRRAIAAATWAARQLERCGRGASGQALRDAILKMPARDATAAAEQALTLLHQVDDGALGACRSDDPESRGWLIIARRHPQEAA
jgi:Tfp pilus assembly protein PilF